MSSEDKFDNFFSHVGKGHVVGMAVFGMCACAIVSARQLAYFDEMVLLTTIVFGAFLMGVLAAAAAGKVLDDHLEKDLPQKKRDEAVGAFHGYTFLGGFAGMFASAPILFLSKNVGEEHLPEILLILAGCILVGALMGAAYGCYKAGKMTAKDKSTIDDSVAVVESGQIQIGQI